MNEAAAIKINVYIKLLRVEHYIKNFLVFIPLFFSLSFYRARNNITCILGFIAFSILSSIVYIINDIQDIEKDKSHSVKRKRPLAAGILTKKDAVITTVILFLLLAGILCVMSMIMNMNVLPGVLMLALYFVLNVIYSLGAKNIPIVDIVIIASGFIIRLLFGAIIINVDISFWLYFVISMGSFYLGFGKRRNEILKQETGTRDVIKSYSYNFLDKNMYICQALCVVFYSLWSIDSRTFEKFGSRAFVFTIPIVYFILLKYSFNIEKSSDGDPVPVILHDKCLILLCLLYILSAVTIVFFANGINGII
jgi:4-hydroxybenzoate polyprenyltransferase